MSTSWIAILAFLSESSVSAPSIVTLPDPSRDEVRRPATGDQEPVRRCVFLRQRPSLRGIGVFHLHENAAVVHEPQHRASHRRAIGFLNQHLRGAVTALDIQCCVGAGCAQPDITIDVDEDRTGRRIGTDAERQGASRW